MQLSWQWLLVNICYSEWHCGKRNLFIWARHTIVLFTFFWSCNIGVSSKDSYWMAAMRFNWLHEVEISPLFGIGTFSILCLNHDKCLLWMMISHHDGLHSQQYGHDDNRWTDTISDSRFPSLSGCVWTTISFIFTPSLFNLSPFSCLHFDVLRFDVSLCHTNVCIPGLHYVCAMINNYTWIFSIWKYHWRLIYYLPRYEPD